MANTYEIGDTIRLSNTFTVSGTATDPSTVTLKVQDPSGNEDTYTYALSQVTKSATGIYYKDVALDEKGVWYYKWFGTGAVASADEGNFLVLGSQFSTPSEGPYILTRIEAADVLRCAEDDSNMLMLLPLVDGYILQATGHNWAADTVIREEAKAAARMLLVRWHEDPGGMAAGAALGFGLAACLTQLEALALRYVTFEGLSSSGYILLSNVAAGTTVESVAGVVGVSGDQSAAFESVISVDGYLQQTSGSDLSDKWYRAYLVPAGAV